MDRRRFLAGLGTGAVAGALSAFGAGCMPRPDPGALVLRGWPYEPDLVRANLERFGQWYPGTRIDYAPISGNYHDKIVAQFVANTPLDLLYVRDDHFAEWIQAGWLQPIDGLSGVDSLVKEMLPFNAQAITYQGRVYGLPYYSDIVVWVWNRKYLADAGIDRCGRTLPEITEQCLKVKEKRVRGPEGLIEFPLVFGFRQAAQGFADFWAMMYASEVELFTPALEPIFPDDPGSRAERILQWMVDAAHKHQILDLNASFTQPLTRDLMGAGRVAMLPISKYDLQRLNDPKKSSAAGNVIMEPMPSIDPGLHGTMGITRLYGLPTHCPHPEQTWELMKFLGGRDPDGKLSTQRFWFLQRGLGFAYPELFEDEAVVQSISRWGELAKIREESKFARARDVIQAPWFAEFDTFYQAELQEIVQARASPRDGLARIAAHCRKLRKAWG